MTSYFLSTFQSDKVFKNWFIGIHCLRLQTHLCPVPLSDFPRICLEIFAHDYLSNRLIFSWLKKIIKKSSCCKHAGLIFIQSNVIKRSKINEEHSHLGKMEWRVSWWWCRWCWWRRYVCYTFIPGTILLSLHCHSSISCTFSFQRPLCLPSLSTSKANYTWAARTGQTNSISSVRRNEGWVGFVGRGVRQRAR